MFAICVRLCSCLCIVCSNISEDLMLATCVRLCSCLCIVCSNVSEVLVFAICVDSVLACAKPAHACVSEALLPALRTLSLSFLTNSSSDSKAFLRFIAFSGSPTAVHCAFLFFDAKAWPQSQTDLFITLWAYLSQTHRPNLQYYNLDIPS